jgi:hypothetical protein
MRVVQNPACGGKMAALALAREPMNSEWSAELRLGAHSMTQIEHYGTSEKCHTSRRPRSIAKEQKESADHVLDGDRCSALSAAAMAQLAVTALLAPISVISLI